MLSRSRVATLLLALVLVPGAAEAKPKLAVMEIQDQTRSLSAGLVEGLTDSLRSLLARSGQYVVIDKSRQAAALKRLVTQQKKESYKSCYDSGCQIPLGQALAADSILRTKLTRVGSQYLAIAELVDLEKEAVTAAAQSQVPAQPAQGRDDRLLQAVLGIARQLSGDSTLGVDGSEGSTTEGRGGIAGVLRSEPVPVIPPPPVESPEEIRAREERARQARLEQEQLALEARRRAEVSAGDQEIRRKRAVRLIYGWMAMIGGGILGATGAYYVWGKAAGHRDDANEATTPEALKSAADQASSARITGGVVLGVGGAALGVGLLLILTAPKVPVHPVNVAGVRLDRLPAAAPSARGALLHWGGSF